METATAVACWEMAENCLSQNPLPMNSPPIHKSQSRSLTQGFTCRAKKFGQFSQRPLGGYHGRLGLLPRMGCFER